MQHRWEAPDFSPGRITFFVALSGAIIVPTAFAADTTPADTTSDYVWPSYHVTWKLQYKSSGISNTNAVAGKAGTYYSSNQAADYSGTAKVAIVGNTTRNDSFSSVAHSISDSYAKTTPTPAAECGPGVVTSSESSTHSELTNPDAFSAVDNNPPRYIILQWFRNDDGLYAMHYPFQTTTPTYAFSMGSHYSTHFCDGTESVIDLPYNTTSTVDGPWLAWNGIPKCVRADLISHDNGATYTNHCDVTLTSPSGPDTIQPTTTQYIVDITVTSDNEAPEVGAGADGEIQVGQAFMLNGGVADDGLPNPPAQTTATWSVDSPSSGSNVIINDVHSSVTSVTFDKPGNYVLRLTATDGQKDAIDTINVKVNGFSLLTPADGAQLNKHLQQVEPGTVKFSWTNVPDASVYTLTLRDKNTGKYLMRDRNMAKATDYSMSNNDLKFGHEYEVISKAITASQTLEDKHTFKIKILPDITDPLTQQMEDGQIVWTNTTPALVAARDKFAQLLQARHWTIKYNSAYRTLYYQEHLYLIVENLKDKKLSSADRIYLEKVRGDHDLGTLVAKPNANSPHVQGIAFDANIKDEHDNPLNGKTWINPELEKLATKQAGFKKPPNNDKVHFQL